LLKFDVLADQACPLFQPARYIFKTALPKSKLVQPGFILTSNSFHTGLTKIDGFKQKDVAVYKVVILFNSVQMLFI